MNNTKTITTMILNPITGNRIPVTYNDPLFMNEDEKEMFFNERKNGKIIDYIPKLKIGYIKTESGYQYVFSIEEVYFGGTECILSTDLVIDEIYYPDMLIEFNKNPIKFLTGKTVSFRSHTVLGPKNYIIAYWIMFE